MKPYISTYKASFVSPYQIKMYDLLVKRFEDSNDITVHNDYRPIWLTNKKTGGILELDIFVESSKPIFYNDIDGVKCCIYPAFGVEVNGDTHYRVVSEYHKTVKDLKEQKFRDRLKRKMCLRRNIPIFCIKNATVEKMQSLDIWLCKELFSARNTNLHMQVAIDFFMKKCKYY